MDATRLYCKRASDFDMFNDFDPAEFEYLNFVLEHEYLLTGAGKYYVNRALIHDFRLYQKEIQNGPKGVVLHDYLESTVKRFMNNDEGEAVLRKWLREPRKTFAEEEQKIFHLLEKFGYIRAEGISQSILLSAIVNDVTPVKTGEKGLFILDWTGYMEKQIDRLYETIKPTTGAELKLIFDVLSEELTTAQYEAVKHYIFKGWRTYFAYTSAEFEALTVAFKNIQGVPSLKSKINKIMDNTLF